MQDVRFKHIDKHGREIVQSVERRDAADFMVVLCEQARVRDFGPMWMEVDGEWQLIDYYNGIGDCNGN